MSTLDKAIEIAAKAHAGSTTKNGEAYILHPLRVMLRCKTDTERIVAVLHDTLEDTHVTAEYLRGEGFSDKVLLALDCVTRRSGEKYLSEFIERIKSNPIAVDVKLADLADNSDPNRKMDIPGFDSLLKKYAKATAILLAHKEIKFKEKELKRMKEAEGG